MNHITGNTSVAEIVKVCPGARRIFDEHGLKGCGGEHGPSEPLAFFAAVHQANLDELLREINRRTSTRKVCRITSIAGSSKLV
jgi:iron-sulfur cluster repair protein YtfE (RIC family)